MSSKKKLLLSLLFFYLGTLVVSTSLRGEEQIPTYDLLTEQENLLLRVQASTEKIQKNNLNLRNQLGISSQKITTLENQLGNFENQLLESNQQLLRANQSVKTLEKNSTQLKETLNESLKSIEQSKKEYQNLQTENTLIKIIGGGLIIGLGIIILLD